MDQCAGREIAGRENDGPFVGHEIARHEITGHENAGHEPDGPKMTAGVKLREKKYSFNRDNITMKCANF